MNAHFTVTCVGDINFAGLTKAGVDSVKDTLRRLVGLKEAIAGSDMAIANLEGPLTPLEAHKARRKHLNNPVWAMELLANLGFDLVTVANNHLMDFGREALELTLTEAEGKVLVRRGHELRGRSASGGVRYRLRSPGCCRGPGR